MGVGDNVALAETLWPGRSLKVGGGGGPAAHLIRETVDLAPALEALLASPPSPSHPGAPAEETATPWGSTFEAGFPRPGKRDHVPGFPAMVKAARV